MAGEIKELYRGKAVIMGVSFQGVEDWMEWERKNLPASDANNAFKIVYDVAEGDQHGARHDVAVEVSHRELKGKMLEFYHREDGAVPTQVDVAIRSLVGQGLMPKGATESDLAAAIDDGLCGRTVFIRAYEEQSAKNGKWYPRCTFASPRNRIEGADNKAARLAAFLSGKAAPKPVEAPAPTQDEVDDLPF